MQTGFPSREIPLVWHGPRQWEDRAGFQFWYRGHLWRCTPGAWTDGMSSPQFTHAIPDAEALGWALPAARPHDAGYGDELEVWDEGHQAFSPVTLDKDECDRLFEALLAVLLQDYTGAELALKTLEAKAFYEAVHLGGQPAFDDDRQRKAVAA